MSAVLQTVSIPSYYDVLQVQRHAAPDDIRAAYRRMAQRYHPDKSPDNAYAPRVMANLNKAYEVLSDPAQRAQHDHWLQREELQRQPAAANRPVIRPYYPIKERVARWPWVLLFITISCGVFSIGTVLYKTMRPTPGALTMGTATSTGDGLALRPSNTLRGPNTSSR